MSTEPNNPLEAAGDVLGNLQEQAKGAVGDLAAKAEEMADGILGEETVDQVKEVLNSDVGDLAKGLMDKVMGKE